MATSQVHLEPPNAAARSFLVRNLGLIVTVSLLVAVWMLIYTFTMFHPRYGAKATVIIKDSAITNRYVEPEQYYAMQTTTSTSSNPVLNTMGILKSEAINDALWVYFSQKHPEELKKLKIKTAKEWDSYYQDGSAFIKAKNQPGTDLIAIQFSWSSPAIAKEALGVVVKAFQDASMDLNKEEQISRTRFLSRQMGDIEAQLRAIRAKKSAYESQNGTVSIKRESDDLAGSRMELSNKLAQLRAQAQGKENLVRRYQKTLGMSPETALRGAALGQNSTMVKLQDELYRLQQLHSLMSSSLTDANPKVQEVQAQIVQVRSNIEQEKARVMGPFGDTAENGEVIADSTRNTLIGDMLKAQGEAQDLRAQASVLQQRLGQVNSDIRQFPGTATGLANLEQQEASLSVALDHLRQRVMEGKMKEAQTLSNVFVVDAPRLPEHPSFPNRMHLLVISLFLSVGSGISIAFIKEQVFSRPAYYPGYPAFPGLVYSEQAESPAEPEHFTVPQAEEAAFPAQPHHPGYAIPATNFTVPPAPPAMAEVPLTSVPDEDDVLGVNLPIEKVQVPATGSLFDSLLPIAGPMARSVQINPSTEVRRDLTQPLPPVSQPAAVQPASTSPAVKEPVAPQAGSIYRDEDLLPPAAPQPAKSAQPGPAREQAPAAVMSPVPVMHAVPSATPRYAKDPMSVSDVPVTVTPAPEIELETGVYDELLQDEFPNLIIDEPAFHEPEASPHQPDPQTHEAAALYEAQARTMPLPRRRGRSIPAFLLDANTIDVAAEDAHFEERQAPYELVPKKQRKTVPNPPVTDPNEALFQDLNPVATAAPAAATTTEFPPMPASIPPEFLRRRRKSLFGGLFAPKKYRQPELVLGGGFRPQGR